MFSKNAGNPESLSGRDIPNPPPLERLPTELKLLLLETVFSLAITPYSPHSQDTVHLGDFLNFTLISTQFYTLASNHGLIRRFLKVFLREDEEATGHAKDVWAIFNKMGYLCAIYTRLRLEMRERESRSGPNLSAEERLRGWSLLDMDFEGILAMDSNPDRFIWEMIRSHALVRDFVSRGVVLPPLRTEKMTDKIFWHEYQERPLVFKTYLRLIIFHPLLLGGLNQILDAKDKEGSRPLLAMLHRVRGLHVELGLWPYEVMREALSVSQNIDYYLKYELYVPKKVWVTAARFTLRSSSGIRKVDISPILQECIDWTQEVQAEDLENTPQSQPTTLEVDHDVVRNFASIIPLEGLLALEFSLTKSETKAQMAQISIVEQVWLRSHKEFWMDNSGSNADVLSYCMDKPFDRWLSVFGLLEDESCPCIYTLCRGKGATRVPVADDISPRLSQDMEEQFLEYFPSIPSTRDEERFHHELNIDHLFRPLPSTPSDIASWTSVVKIAMETNAHKHFGWFGEKIESEKKLAREDGGSFEKIIRKDKEWMGWKAPDFDDW